MIIDLADIPWDVLKSVVIPYFNPYDNTAITETSPNCLIKAVTRQLSILALVSKKYFSIFNKEIIILKGYAKDNLKASNCFFFKIFSDNDLACRWHYIHPLQCAIAQDNISILKIILNANCKLEKIDKVYKYNPMVHAKILARTELVKTLEVYDKISKLCTS